MRQGISALLGQLRRERGVLWLAVIGFVISLPALRLPFEMDDHWLRVNYARGHGPLQMILGLKPEDVAPGKSVGALAWWADDGLRLQFFRPLASLTHYAEFALWGDRAWPMHCFNVVLYVLLVALAASSYRALARSADKSGAWSTTLPLSAALAGLLFALEPAHASSTGWISARNSLLAANFAIASLWTQVRASTQGWKLGHVLSPGAFGLGLLSGESGLQALGYLIAFALVLDRRPRAVRLWSLAPHAALLVAWVVYYTTHGYGAHGSDWYRDPGPAPLQTLLEAAWDLPLWLGSALIASFASASLFANEVLIRALWLGVLALLAPPLWHVLRRSQLARFHAWGLMLCLVPLALTRPQDRLLLCASFGASGLIALAIEARSALGSYGRRAANALAVLHLGLSPVLYLALLGQAEPIERSARALASELPVDASASEVVVIDLPLELLLYIAREQREAAGQTLPLYMRLLYAGSSSLRVTRSDARTLDLRASRGWFDSPTDRIFTTLSPGYHPGQRWVLPGMTAEVVNVGKNRAPDRMRFTFASDLDDPKRVFINWREQRPQRWTPPVIGQTVELPGLSVLRSLSPLE